MPTIPHIPFTDLDVVHWLTTFEPETPCEPATQTGCSRIDLELPTTKEGLRRLFAESFGSSLTAAELDTVVAECIVDSRGTE